MPNTEVNISLKSKSNPVINITTVDSGTVTGSAIIAPTVSFISTGPRGAVGAKGDNGNDGTAVVAPNSITATEIAPGVITATEIASNSITAGNLAVGAVTNHSIADGAIAASKIADGTITSGKLASGTISSAVIDIIDNNAIDKSKIAEQTLDASTLATDSILTSKVKDRNITGAKIESNADLDGEVKVHNLKLKGSSPATLTGPDNYALQIKSNTTIDFQNTSNTTIASLDQNGNLTLSGTVDGINIATDVAANSNKTGITTAQANAIIANTAKTVITTSQANAITANTAKVDLTVENAGTVHASNYTDTNTTYDVMGSGNSYAAGLIPAGSAAHSNNFLRKDGTFAIPYIYLGMDGIALSFNQISVDLKANGGLVIENGKIALDLGASSITNNLTIPAAYTDAEAVSAVAAADNYIKNDANEVLAGSLEISEQLFVVKSTGGSKSRFRNSSTTTNRTLEVPDASGTLALTSDIPSFTPNPTVIGQFSTRVSSYWSGRYYYGHASYGWNYFAWNYATTSKTTLDDRYIHVGMVSPITTNNVKVRATVRNDSNTENVELCLLKGLRPNGSSSNVSLTELGSVTVTISTVDLHYNGDIDVTNANLAAGDLVFLAVKRVSSAADATKYIQVSATIYGE